MTVRGLDTLKECTAIVCEDTRVTGQLLKLLELPKKELISCHGYSDPAKIDWIISKLKKDEHLCLVSDAGTPCISDPGYALVSKAREAGIKIEVIPGASAFLAALSASGLPINQFSYLGFLPLKKGRQTLLKQLHDEERTIVFYESPHRILKTLGDLHSAFHDQPERQIVICRELTKMHEEVISSTIGNLLETSKNLMVKGEFVVVIGPTE
jgi:16S rRNA (cytidine1402-2'-O)-methyltransferase